MRKIKKVYCIILIIYYVSTLILQEKKLLIINKQKYQDYLIYTKNKMNNFIL